MIIIEECWKSIKQHPSNPSERQAMAAMTLNAIKNGGNLGLFSEMTSWLQLPHLDLHRAHRLGVLTDLPRLEA